jgi:hypothetical protein
MLFRRKLRISSRKMCDLEANLKAFPAGRKCRLCFQFSEAFIPPDLSVPIETSAHSYVLPPLNTVRPLHPHRVISTLYQGFHRRSRLCCADVSIAIDHAVQRRLVVATSQSLERISQYKLPSILMQEGALLDPARVQG